MYSNYAIVFCRMFLVNPTSSGGLNYMYKMLEIGNKEGKSLSIRRWDGTRDASGAILLSKAADVDWSC